MAFEPIPARQRWTAESAGDAAAMSAIPTPLFRKADPIAFIGGQFAAALIEPLARAGFQTVAAERRHPILAELPPEAAEYEAFGNGYGEVLDARAFRQLVERAVRTFTPQEDRWHEDGRVVDPFRPALRYTAASDREFDVLGERHLNTVRSAFRRARSLVVALSQSEVWESCADGAVFPHWASEAERRFDPERHAVRTLTVKETIADLAGAIAALRTLNPGIELVLMVSPEPQAATALPVHVVAAGSLGKAVLRIAMEVAARADGVHYFPALEIAAQRASGSDYRPGADLPPAALDAVVQALVDLSEGGGVTFVADPDARPLVQAEAPDVPARPVPAAEVSPAAPGKGAGRGKAAGAKAARPKPATVNVVDAFATAKAAADADKKRLRQAKRQPTKDVEPTNPEEKRARKQAERQAKRAETVAVAKAERAAKLSARAAKNAAEKKPGAARGIARGAKAAGMAEAAAVVTNGEKPRRAKTEAPARVDAPAPKRRAGGKRPVPKA